MSVFVMDTLPPLLDITCHIQSMILMNVNEFVKITQIVKLLFIGQKVSLTQQKNSNVYWIGT
jgi:hypothetical protein